MSYFGSFLWDFLGLITALLVVTVAYYKWTYQYWRRRNVPYFEPKIPFGNLDKPFSKPVGDHLYEIYNKAKAKGWKYVGVYTMLRPVLLILDLELVKNVLTKDFQYFIDRGGYVNEKDDPVGAHLFSLPGTKWRNLRTKLTPTFTSGKLKSMFQTLVDCGLVFEKYVEENIKPTEPVDIKHVLACFSTDVIGSCAFGLECNSFKEPNSLFRYYGNKIFAINKRRAIKIMFTQSFPGLARAMGVKEVADDVADFFTKVVHDTVSYREKNNVTRKDFLQMLIEMRNSKEGNQNGHNDDDFTMNTLVAQSFVFFAAGFETSSTTMTFALFELATHQDIQDKLRDEIHRILANHDGQMTYDSLSEMKYMSQVIDETLRIHSPARLLHRVCVKDYKVPGEDLVIEKGTKVYISIKGPQYDEEYWDNPTEFNPDRFSEEKKKNMNPYIQLPFGQGPRMCIGERFGLMQVKVGLTSLLRKYKVELDKKTKLPLKMTPTSVVSSAEGGIWLNLEKV